MKDSNVANTKTDKNSPLISAQELHNLLSYTDVKIFDVRGTWKTPARSLYDVYRKSHITSAVFLDWTQYFLEQNTALNLASVSEFEHAKQSFSELGINRDDLVVLYDDYHHMFAGRIWWAMKYWGFDNVKVLNGGWGYWNDKQYPSSTQENKYQPGNYMPSCQKKLRVSLDEFLIQMKTSTVIDARGPEGYNGKPEDPRTGHIPSAINLSFRHLINEETGLFLHVNEIEHVVNKTLKNWNTEPIITSCGSGYAGTVAMLALCQLGIKSSLFDGSFAAWKQDPTREIQQSQ